MYQPPPSTKPGSLVDGPKSGEVDLSVIIVNWKSAQFVRKCLESIYTNAKGLKFEIILVDNASFDGCAEMIREEFPKVHFIQSQQNLGFAGANNLGFDHSIGRNILFLNPDTEIIGAALQEMLSFLESTADAGAVGCKLLNSDLSLQTSCIQRFPSILNQALDADYLRAMFPKSALWGTKPLYVNSGRPAAVDVISGACLMIKRSVFEKVGRFATDYFMYAEDADLCYKIKQASWRSYYVDRASVIHHGGRSSDAKPENNFAAIMMRESLLKFMRLRRGKWYAAAYQWTMALVAAFRLFLLGSILLLTIGRLQRHSLSLAFAKWAKVFRWALRLEGWAKEST